MELKTCSKCNRELNITNFNKKKEGKNGFCSECKQCATLRYKKWREENKEKVADYHKEYIKNNKDSLGIYKKEYNENNKEKTKEYQNKNKVKISNYNKIYRQKNPEKSKEYYEKNKEYHVAKSKEYYEKNKEIIASKNKKYQLKNPEKFRVSTQKYKAKKRTLEATLTLEQWVKIKDYFNEKCAYCGKESKLEQEHFTPLSKGGEYTHNNIIPACKSCNSSKRDKNFFEWYPKQKYYNKKREVEILNFLNYKGDIQQTTIYL